MAVAHAEHAADVAQRRLRRHRAEGRDLAHRVAAVLRLHVVDDAVAVGLAEVDVEVGHRHALGIEEALEQQLVAERIEVGDVERVGDQRAGARAAARADRAAVRLRPVDEVGDDQEVAGEAHLQDRLDLEVEARDVARPLALARGRVGVELLQARLEAVVRGDAEVLGHRHAHAVDERRLEVGQLRLAEDQAQVAALGDLDRVGERARQVGEERLHLRLALEVLLAAEALDAARVGEHLAVGDADARLVRLVVVGVEELHRVGGDDRQREARGELDRGAHVRLVAGQAAALHLDVEAARERSGRGARRAPARAHVVAGQQRAAERAVVGARERDQAVGALGEPRPFDRSRGRSPRSRASRATAACRG